MLERSIVFVSDNPGRLAVCVLACIPLLRPFVWQGALSSSRFASTHRICSGTYVPLLPPHLIECLQVRTGRRRSVRAIN